MVVIYTLSYSHCCSALPVCIYFSSMITNMLSMQQTLTSVTYLMTSQPGYIEETRQASCCYFRENEVAQQHFFSWSHQLFVSQFPVWLLPPRANETFHTAGIKEIIIVASGTMATRLQCGNFTSDCWTVFFKSWKTLNALRNYFCVVLEMYLLHFYTFKLRIKLLNLFEISWACTPNYP